MLNANNSEGDLPVASGLEHSVPNCTLIPMSQKIPRHLGPLIPRQCKFAMGMFVYRCQVWARLLKKDRRRKAVNIYGRVTVCYAEY